MEGSTLSSADRIFGITNIKSFISVTLNMEEHNYALWRLMFEMHCATWEVDGYLNGTTVSKGPEDKAWQKRDNLIKMWIYNTIAPSLLQMVMKKSDTANQLWKALEGLFQSNKDARAMQINEDLRNTRLGDLSIEAYCHKMKVYYDLLENIGEPIAERTLVMHTINGLSEKFGNIATFIRHQKPLPTFLDTKAMLELEETRFKSTAESSVIKDSPSSPTVLHVQGNNNSARNSQVSRNFIPQICRNYYRGNCSYGERCKFVHVSQQENRFNSRKQHAGNNRNVTAGNYNQVKNNSILGQAPIMYYCSPSPHQAQTHYLSSPQSSPVPPGFVPSSATAHTHTPSGQQLTHGVGSSFQTMNSGITSNNGQAMHVQQCTNEQFTTLPQAFANMSFKDNGKWYMDTGATSHLTTDAGVVDSWAAMLMGVLAGSIPWYTMMVLHKKSSFLQRVDDTLGVFHTHAVAGLLGGLSAGIFAKPNLVKLFYNLDTSKQGPGLLYSIINPNEVVNVQDGLKQMGYQIMGAVFIASWNVVITSVICVFLRLIVNLKMHEDDLEIGDDAVHGEEAYALWGDGQRDPHLRPLTTKIPSFFLRI